MYITVSSRAREQEHKRAAQIAEREGWTLVSRRSADWSQPVMVVLRTGLAIRRDGRNWRWHEGMLHTLREAGAKHPMVRLGGIQRGDRVLDATLGLGTDARFLAEWTGETVVGLELSPAIALLTQEGLASVGADVEVRRGDALKLMPRMPENAFDIVIADPMFPPRPADAPPGSTLDAIRGVAHSEMLGLLWRDVACRVARRAVVVRDMVGSGILEAMEPEEIAFRHKRLARYGVWKNRCQTP